ncbi:hypothetical protein [Aquitalea sp. ASV15]|uniref:hypothetical protein n=1 Tax=Aquitalea sp. ASV15 TaxID=2795104 RepID=UPI0018ED9D6F|nr:hypothetical protein [Aquitalea sp. ASV15]
MHCTMEAAQQHASEPVYPPIAAVSPPRPWRWIVLSVLLVLGDALLTLLRFSQSTPAASQQERFWWYALMPGCLLAGLAVSLRWAWYALWQLFANVQQHAQAQHHGWWLACRQESACVHQSLLWGPVCGDVQRRDMLARGLHTAPPRAAEGVLRLADVVSAAAAAQQQRREDMLSAFAKTLATWLHDSPVHPSGFAWCGRAEDWSALRLHLQRHGLNLPPQPQLEGGIAMLEYIIDRLHDETRSVKAIVCLGLHCPAPDDSRSVPAGEAAFAIMLSRHGGAFRLHRPVPLSGNHSVARAQGNAALKEAPASYLSASDQANALLENASWPLLEQPQQAYWGDPGPLQAWVTLLRAMDQTQINASATAWLATEDKQDWLGVVTPAPLSEKGKPCND